MKRRIIWPYILIALILLIGVALLVFQLNFVVLGETIYPRNLESLELSEGPLPEPERLLRFTQLKQLDLRQVGITIEQYDQLSQMLPNCHIQWLVPFQGSLLPLDTEKLTLTDFAEEDIVALQRLPQLKHITLIDCDDTELTEMLAASLPNCQILSRYTIGSTLVDQNTHSFQSTNIKNIITVLEMFPQIKLIDATGCPNYTTLAKLQSQYPGRNILYKVPVGDDFLTKYTTDIHLESAQGIALDLVLAALPWVKTVKIDQPVPNPDMILQLRQDYPHIQFTYCFDLFGTVVTPETESVNISGVKLENAAEFEKYLPHFSNLKRAEMRRCGISNAEMDALKQRYPDIFFIWEVQIGHAWIRTDVTYFMPYKHRLVLYDQHVDNLKYLTELICLDMGHMKVTRTDYLAYMPKLQYLLMCSTPITDISHCANMKDLKYVELFLTKVTDFSPLLECKNLVDLNICYTKPDDPLIFGQMKQLKNLWFRNMMDWQVRSQLRQALPNTTMVFDPGSSTGGGWRKLPNYYAQRDILHMPYMEED